MSLAHLIRFADQDTRLRAIRVFFEVPFSRVRFPGNVMGLTDEHIRALKKARIQFIYVSRRPSRKLKDASTVQP
jgi:hypothetical protein